MNRKLKNSIKEAFAPPAPLQKQAFVRKFQPPQITLTSFVLSQAVYIRKWVWALDLGILLFALAGAALLEQNLLWMLSAMTPLLAVTIITESGRSETYGMAELEMASRFSLKSVILARMGILGIANLLIFSILIPVNLINRDGSLLKTGVYLLCPYLITTLSGLWISRKIRGKESAYMCIGIALMVSFGSFLLHQAYAFIYENNYFIWWLASFFLLIAGVIQESSKLIRQTEEFTWN